MQKPDSVLLNEKYKILWNFDIQTDNQILARKSERVIFNKNKENLPNSGLCRPGKHRVQIKESKNRDKFLGFARELKKL